MKPNLVVVLVSGVALLSGLAFSQGPAAQEPDRLEILEKDLVASRARVEGLAAELAAFACR